MYFHFILGTNLISGQEIKHIFPLISLQLNDETSFGIFDQSSIGGIRLLERLQDLLEIEIISETLNCRQAFTTVSLLNTNVNVCACLVLFHCRFREVIRVAEHQFITERGHLQSNEGREIRVKGMRMGMGMGMEMVTNVFSLDANTTLVLWK